MLKRGINALKRRSDSGSVELKEHHSAAKGGDAEQQQD
jgi:hypothetical protein